MSDEQRQERWYRLDSLILLSQLQLYAQLGAFNGDLGPLYMQDLNHMHHHPHQTWIPKNEGKHQMTHTNTA